MESNNFNATSRAIMKKTVATNLSEKCSIRRTVTSCLLIVAIILSVDLLASAESPELVLRDTQQNEFARALVSYEIISPAKVLASGDHLSHDVIHHLRPDMNRRKRRSAASWEKEDGDQQGENDDIRVHYKMTVEGDELHLDLTPNDDLFAPGLVVERRRRGGRAATSRGEGYGQVERIAHNKCHFVGKVKGRPESTVAIATCDGLCTRLSWNQCGHLQICLMDLPTREEKRKITGPEFSINCFKFHVKVADNKQSSAA